MKALIFSFTSLLLAGTLSAQTHWTDENCYDTSWYDASASTYTIGNAAQLAGVACLVNEGTTFDGKTILLSADIDLNGMLWTPIGNGEETGQTNAEGLPQQAAFQGTLDGQGHTVSNMHIEASAKAGQEYTKSVYLGLVGLMSEDGKVANLNIGGDSHIKFEQIPFAEGEEPDGYVSSSLLYVYAGGVCGAGNAYNCTNNSTLSIQGIEYADATVGGIVGDGEAQDCQNQGAVRATDLYEPDAGGIVGTGAASGCVNYGSVSLTARGNQGGIVGYGSAYGCTNHGTLSAYADDGYSIYMGGIIGKGTSVINCSNEGLLETDLHSSIYASNMVNAGGLAGIAETVANSYNKGDIAITGGNGNAIVGGIAASVLPTYIRNCYQSASISIVSTGSFEIFGQYLIAATNDESRISNCYYNADNWTETVETWQEGISAMTTEEMCQPEFASLLSQQAGDINAELNLPVEAVTWQHNEGNTPTLTQDGMHVVWLCVADGWMPPMNTPTLLNNENQYGKLTANVKYATTGTPIELEAIPAEGYKLDKLTVYGSEGMNGTDYILFEQTDTTPFDMPDERRIYILAEFVDEGTGIGDNAAVSPVEVRTEQGSIAVHAPGARSTDLVSASGRTVTAHGDDCIFQVPQPGLYVVKVLLEDGTTVVRKVLAR